MSPYVYDLDPADFPSFFQTLLALRPSREIEEGADPADLYAYVADPEDSETPYYWIDSYSTTQESFPDEKSETGSVLYMLSCMFDCKIVEEACRREDLYVHYERGTVSDCWVNTYSGDAVFGVPFKTSEALAFQTQLVTRLLQTLVDAPEEASQFLQTLHASDVCEAVLATPPDAPDVHLMAAHVVQSMMDGPVHARQLLTKTYEQARNSGLQLNVSVPTALLRLIDLHRHHDTELRERVELYLVRFLIFNEQWDKLQQVLDECDLSAERMTEILEATNSLDLSVLQSAQVTPAMVQMLASRPDEATQLAITAHFYASATVLELLTQSPYPTVSQAAQAALTRQPEKVREAALSSALTDQVFAASDRLAPDSSLRRLALSRRPAVLKALTENPVTPPEALQTLCAELPLPHLLKAVAAHRNAPIELLELLSHSSTEPVRKQALARLAEHNGRENP